MAIEFGETFVANTRDYSRANAYWLGQASLLAYATAPEIQAAVAGWGLTTDFQFFDKLETQAFIAGDDRLLILAFRGTTRLLDWIQDAQFDLVGGPAGRVHEGFLVALSFVWREVLDFIQTKRNGRAIWVTGHSLGAALAAIPQQIDGFDGLRFGLGDDRVEAVFQRGVDGELHASGHLHVAGEQAEHATDFRGLAE